MIDEKKFTFPIIIFLNLFYFFINIFFYFLKKYNNRENKRSAKSIISLIDNTSLLLNHPEEQDNRKRFIYDHIFWSHDGFTEASNGLFVADPGHQNGPIYADQVYFYLGDCNCLILFNSKIRQQYLKLLHCHC